MATLTLHKISGQSTDTANTIAANGQGTLCCGWKGNGNQDITLMFNTDQGVPDWSWAGRVVLPNSSTNHAPAITFFGRRLFIAWISSDGKNNVCYTFSDDAGKSFGPVTVLTNTNSKSAPALASGKSLLISFTDQEGLLNVMSVG